MAQLKLLSTQDEGGNTRTFVFEAEGQEWIAGQHDSFVLPQAGEEKSANKRWFTIASAPSDGEIRITTRLSGSSFKRVLNSLQPGDTIEVLGVAGRFTWEDEAPVVLVAGGIGITPYRSILRERHARGKALNATLLYFNRNEQFVFRSEFEELEAQHPELQIRYLVGEIVTADRILELAPEAATRTIYISGPEPMVESVGKALKERGFTVKQDWFPGYDESNY